MICVSFPSRLKRPRQQPSCAFLVLNALACCLLHQGMGGQHGYFGLWLDSDFGRGHSRARPKCTTYGSPQLSAEEDFSLDCMEVWAVGNPAPPDEVEHLNWLTFNLYSSPGKRNCFSVVLGAG